MRITVADITLEAESLNELKTLLAFVPEVRAQAQALPVATSAKASTSASLGVTRFRRTREEIGAGLSPEQAFNKRIASGDVKASDLGVSFSESDDIDLENPPV